MAHKQLKLPDVIIGPADLARVIRRLDDFNEQEHQNELRTKGKSKADPARLGKLYVDLATDNGFDLRVTAQRDELLAALEETLKSAPTVTMSFAVDPSADMMAKLVSWFRTSIHPETLVRIGLQPNMAAGCTLKTASKMYDFTMRSRLAAQRDLLVRRLHSLTQTGVTINAPTVEAEA